MGLRRLTGGEINNLTYDQAGFDVFTKDHNDVGGFDHVILYPGAGNQVNNQLYLDIPSPYWIGIHNCGTELTAESVSIMAKSVVGDDFARDGIAADFNIDVNYLHIPPGDIVFGKFSVVSILKTLNGLYIDRIRLIRAV